MEHQRESTIVTKSGDVRLIRWSHVTRHDPDGRVAGVASLGEDITAIRAAEDAARRGAEMLSRLVVSSPLPTVVLPRPNGPALEPGRRRASRLDRG
jgi:PAS domain-containing protein